MIKWLLVLLVVVVVGSLLFGRGARRDAPPPAARKRPPGGAPVAMLSCTHCGVHLPADDAVRDGADRAFCSDAHRIAGPR